jgi:hypothetical protein
MDKAGVTEFTLKTQSQTNIALLDNTYFVLLKRCVSEMLFSPFSAILTVD